MLARRVAGVAGYVGRKRDDRSNGRTRRRDDARGRIAAAPGLARGHDAIRKGLRDGHEFLSLERQSPVFLPNQG